MRAEDLECSRVVLVDEVECVIGGLEEVGTLEELRSPLVARLEDHLEEFVDGLVGRDRPEDRLELFVLRSELDAVLLGKCLRELAARKKATGDQDLAETAALFALRGERTLELRLSQELHVDQQVPEWPPSLLRFGRDCSERCLRAFPGREVNAVLIG